MSKRLLFIFFVFFSFAGSAQYWFGPKVGISYFNPIYQDASIEDDLYDVDNDFDFQVGAALNYTATDLYSVYTEMVYERVNRKLVNKSLNPFTTSSNSVNKFISKHR